MPIAKIVISIIELMGWKKATILRTMEMEIIPKLISPEMPSQRRIFFCTKLPIPCNMGSISKIENMIKSIVLKIKKTLTDKVRVLTEVPGGFEPP